jgi:dihydroxyacetone kinase-like predicted kinase
VVDAGGYGLTIMIAGAIAALRGTEAPSLDHHAPARITHPQHASSTFRFCTNFAVTGRALDAHVFIPALETVGDSVLVVGDRLTLKVHVHTDDPDRAVRIFEGAGTVSRLDVADMREQIRERDARMAEGTAACGALAVVSGPGMRALFEGLGANTLDGGATLNPSTYELLAGIHAVPAEAVVVLPNSPNVIMAAERAAELSDKAVRVVPSRSQQAGLAAAVALDPAGDLDGIADAMGDALEHVRTGGVAPAARDDPQGRFRCGDALAFEAEDIVAWGTPEEALRAVLGALAPGAELVTCLAGEGAPLGEEEVAALAPPGIELEWRDGGQPSWWWLLAAE